MFNAISPTYRRPVFEHDAFCPLNHKLDAGLLTTNLPPPTNFPNFLQKK